MRGSVVVDPGGKRPAHGKCLIHLLPPDGPWHGRMMKLLFLDCAGSLGVECLGAPECFTTDDPDTRIGFHIFLCAIGRISESVRDRNDISVQHTASADRRVGNKTLRGYGADRQYGRLRSWELAS